VTWNLVFWERNGKNQKQRVRMFVTDSHIYSDGVPLPDDKGSKSWPDELGPGDKPNAATMLDIRGTKGTEKGGRALNAVIPSIESIQR
jgi:hypothetical protein